MIVVCAAASNREDYIALDNSPSYALFLSKVIESPSPQIIISYHSRRFVPSIDMITCIYLMESGY